MLRGVLFKYDGGSFLSKLNELMDVSMYDWYVDDMEANFYECREGEYEKQDFRKIIDTLCLLSFARIRRYPDASPIKEINSYADFYKSECDLLILFYDGGIYEIYSKDSLLIQNIYQICEKMSCYDLEFITDTNDQRSHMHY